MTEAFYEILEEPDPGMAQFDARLRSSPLTTGPWGPGLQHAGPPAALLARAVRRLGSAPERALAARLSFDILAPVPVADLVLTARMLRPGRRVALAQADLAEAAEPDRPLMTVRAWLVRQLGPQDAVPGLPATSTGRAPAPPDPWVPMVRPVGWHPGYLDAIDWHWVSGSLEEPGPAEVWTRLRGRLVDIEAPDPLDRLVAVADSASGISAVASPTTLLFVNTDLTLHLTRQPVDEVIWMRARTWLDGSGIGRTTGEIGDGAGTVATSAQCLFVASQGT